MSNSIIEEEDSSIGLIQRDIGEIGGNIIMSLMIVIIFPIVFGNSLVLHVYRITPKLKIPINLLLVNLALTDLAVGAIVIPYNLIKLYAPFGLADYKFSCMLTFYFLKVLLSESGLTILLISLVRFISVTKPMYSAIWITKKRVKMIVVLSWIYMMGIYAFAVFYFSIWEEGFDCNIKKVSGKIDFLITCIHVAMFCIFTFGFNIAFICKLKNRPKITIGTVISDMDKVEARKTRMVRAIVVCFYACWVPHLVYHIFCVVKPEQANSVLANSMKWGATVVLQANSFLNPIIYAGYNPTFRKGYIKALTCKQKSDDRRTSCQQTKISKVESDSCVKKENFQRQNSETVEEKSQNEIVNQLYLGDENIQNDMTAEITNYECITRL